MNSIFDQELCRLKPEEIDALVAAYIQGLRSMGAPVEVSVATAKTICDWATEIKAGTVMLDAVLKGRAPIVVRDGEVCLGLRDHDDITKKALGLSDLG